MILKITPFSMTIPFFLFFLAANPVWTIDHLMDLKTIHDPQITQDGSKVAYVVRQVNLSKNRYESTIQFQSVDQKKVEKIQDAHYTDSTPRWSPDGNTLAFLSRRTGTNQIYFLRSGKSSVLTSSPTSIGSFMWSPDGKTIAYIAQADQTETQKGKQTAGDDAIVAGEEKPINQIWLIEVHDLPVRLLAIQRHILSMDWSPDGSKIVYSAQKTASGTDIFHSDLYEYDLRKNVETVLVEQPGQDLFPTYSPDGKHIAFYSQCGSLVYFGERQIGIVRSGSGSVRYISRSLDGDVFGGASRFWWSPDSKRIVFGAGKGTREHLYSIEIESGKHQTLLQQISGTASFSLNRDGSRVAWLRAFADKPPDLHIFQTLNSSDHPLTDLNPSVKELPSVQAQTIKWKSKDGMVIEGVLRMPFHSSRNPVPLLTIIHGGPTGASLENFPVSRLYPVQLFLESGYAIFEPNFRGSINYGVGHRLPTIQQQGFGDMADVMTGIDSLVEQGIADPNRLGVMGWSYGGFLSAWIVGNTNRFKAASIGACAMDWTTYYGMSVGIADAPPEVVREYFGGTPWKNFEAYDRHSPRFFLKNVKTPSLLLRGEKDLDTMSEMYVALKELDVPVSFVTYPREPHGIGEPVHQRNLLDRNFDWFQRWIPVQ